VKALDATSPQTYSRNMRKPLHLLTPEERAALAAELKKEGELEGDLPLFIGNPNSLFLARPARRKKPAARKVAKVTA
jgi:hypothetical protein